MKIHGAYMKKRIKEIDKQMGGTIKKYFHLVMRILTIPQLNFIRFKVASRVGFGMFIKNRNLKVIAFPNALIPAKYLGKSSYALEKILAVNGITPKQFTPWEKSDLIIDWQDSTVNAIDARAYIDESYRYAINDGICYKEDLNFDCYDISKSRIGEINKQIFGYDYNIDPTNHKGRCVSKSNNNATHDGRIIDCPIDEDEVVSNAVYCVLVDNTDEENAVDFRVIYINGIIDVFYEKRRPLSSRFSNTNTSVALRNIRDEFSDDEIYQIESFCRMLGATYGELDVLRDVNSRRIYIVDFAKTPAGPPSELSGRIARKAVEEMGVAFCNNILAPISL